MLAAAQPTCFLIADISGYTGYLADVELDHAQDILADLIGTVVTALRPNFQLAKLEGDAAFTFATTERLDGTMLLDTIERCYFGFRRRRRDVRQSTACDCNACVRIPDLFIGNPKVGYKVALCQRDVAIYGGILLFGLVFSLTGRRTKSLPWYWWVVVGIIPIAMDGLSQLLSQPPLAFFPYRESTPFFRTLTGLAFGFTTAWYGYPLVEETMADMRRYLDGKRQRARTG